MNENTMICTVSSLYVRNKPDINGEKIGIIFKNQETEFIKYAYSDVEKETLVWIEHKFKNITGYSLANYLTFKYPRKPSLRKTNSSSGRSGSGGGGNAIGPIAEAAKAAAEAAKKKAEEAAKKAKEKTNIPADTTTTDLQGAEDPIVAKEAIDLQDYDFYRENIKNNEPIRGFRAVLGLPYHFLKETDPRYVDGKISDDGNIEDYGAEFTEKILNRCPILFISPGYADFMSAYSYKDKKAGIEKLITGSETELSEMLSGDKTGRYYTFKYALKEYFTYVNPMCRMAALNLNIENRTYFGTKLKSIHWGYDSSTSNGILNNLAHILGSTGENTSVAFYLNGETSISESFSNNSTESQMASAVNGVSDMARELNYLLGYSQSALNVDNFDLNSAVQNVTDTISGLMGKSSFISKLSNHLSTVATGGRMIFPKIWASSNFSRSYNVEMKFTSPDADAYSIFLNILVPLFHLVAFVAPHQIGDDPNSYSNPFIVRCMYKGFFNIDLGLITSMSVNKGAEGQWTPEGIPTTVTVSLTIEDLYDVMSITPTSVGNSIFGFKTTNNTALMDYIATWCGIEQFMPEIGRWLQSKRINSVEAIRDGLRYGIWSSVQDSLSTKIMNLYRKVL